MATTTSEAATAAETLETPRTLCEAFQASAARRGDAPALRTPGDEVVVTWTEYAQRARAIAAGLAAHGVKRGDTVAILLTNRPEGHLVDVGALHLGALPFSVYNTSSPEQIEYILTHAGSSVVVTERQYLDRVIAVRDQLESLRYIFVVDGATAGAAGLDELEASGEPDFDFDAAWRAAEPSDVATLIYTSGTTGPPKGVELTHDNIMWDTTTWIELTGTKQDGRVMSHLPMAHLADRVCGHYVGIITGATVTCVADAKKSLAAVAESKPTLWLGVPRVWEKLKAALEAKFAGEPDPDRKAAIAHALALGVERCRLEQAGEPVPAELAAEYQQANETILTPIRRALGFEPDAFLISGAAAFAREVLEFFDALGMPINEGYGMTECSCITSLNFPDRRYGTVGKPLPGVEVKLAEDGELLVRGRLVFRGYRNDPEKTAEAKDADGWFYTGDIADLTDGFVRIVDRKKDLIINAAGKNMSPANIEQAIKGACSLVGIPVVIGEARSYNTALIVLEPDAVRGFASENGIGEVTLEELAEHAFVLAELEAAIERANARLSRVEQIKKFTVIKGEWAPGGDELTPTLKPKRKPISAKYAELIETMYS